MSHHMDTKKDVIKPQNKLNVHFNGHNTLYPITLDNPFKATCPNHSDVRIEYQTFFDNELNLVPN